MLDLTDQSYRAVEPLRDGRSIEIRALRPADETRMLAAISPTTPQSLCRRVFGAKKDFSEGEKAFFFNIDFIGDVALVAALEHSGRTAIVGGARYVVSAPGIAEVAFTVVDEFQGNGIGSALMSHLILLARRASLEQLVADILPHNITVMSILKKTGLLTTITRAKGVVHVTLDLPHRNMIL